MSEAGQAPQPGAWWDKLFRMWAQTRLAHEGMMLEKIGRQNQIVQQNATALMAEAHGGQLPEVEEMGVSIGNETHNTYTVPAANGGTLQKLLPWILAAGLGGGLLWSQWPDRPAGDDDTDTVIEYTPGFGTPEMKQ